MNHHPRIHMIVPGGRRQIQYR
ncbi:MULTISPECIES: hypothetical protein [Bradyrhizobium]